jgi:nucleoside-diphosphate-sugar epimerase
MITINQLAEMVSEIAEKTITIKNTSGPIGVRKRNSDNTLIREKLNWAPSQPLKEGLAKTFEWINKKVIARKTELA